MNDRRRQRSPCTDITEEKECDGTDTCTWRDDRCFSRVYSPTRDLNIPRDVSREIMSFALDRDDWRDLYAQDYYAFLDMLPGAEEDNGILLEVMEEVEDPTVFQEIMEEEILPPGDVLIVATVAQREDVMRDALALCSQDDIEMALEIAVDVHGDPDVINTLVEYGAVNFERAAMAIEEPLPHHLDALIQLVEISGSTRLHTVLVGIALRLGKMEIARMVLREVRVYVPYLLSIVLRGGNVPAIQLLVEECGATDFDAYLQQAVSTNQVEIAEYLIEQGATVQPVLLNLVRVLQQTSADDYSDMIILLTQHLGTESTRHAEVIISDTFSDILRRQ